MSKNALVISLNFNPGHVSHLVASYKQCEEIGYSSTYLVANEFVDFLPQNCRMTTLENSELNAQLAIFLFPSQKNLPLIWKLKRKGCKIIYIFHEPLAPMKVYYQSGFSIRYLIKLWLINRVSALTVKWSDIILLPSNKAFALYRDNVLYKNNKYFYLPLMYADEREDVFENKKRLYFSYIGTIAADHSFTEYLNFVKWAVTNNVLQPMKFLIATKSEFEIPDELKNNARVVIHKGKPMTDSEINGHYASSLVLWNAYARTTQSGVLAKSFMFGTPALVMRHNLNEFMHDGRNVVSITDNSEYNQIETAISHILNNYDSFSKSARDEFEESFLYKKYNNQLKEIISSCN